MLKRLVFEFVQVLGSCNGSLSFQTAERKLLCRSMLACIY